MRLVPCSRPDGSLDPAPLTALCAPEGAPGAVAYEGFWGEDDGYYLRRTEHGVANWLAGRADDQAPAAAAGTRRSGSHAAIVAAAEATAGRGVGRWRVMLVGQLGRQHGRQRARVPMHVCVRRARSAP